MKKKNTRRQFIETSIKLGVTVPILGTGLLACNSNTDTKGKKEEKKKLNILILGGTSFLGPHQIAYALGRGHKVSTFTRGKTLPSVHRELFTEVEQLIGDRVDNLSALEGKKWDVVIDNSGHKAEWTKKTAELLKDNCGLYVYTSSTGVFFPYTTGEYKEDSKVLMEMPENVDEELKLEYDYGIMKANSEQEAIKQFGVDRTLIVRPTYMLGPADKTNRFIHWPIRLPKGGDILVPGKKEDPVQYMDVRDVAEWMIRLIEENKTGTFNAVGPKNTQTMHEFMDEAIKTFDAPTNFVYVDDYDFLEENKVYYIVPWIMPTGPNRDTARIDNQKAKANGLSFRSITETIKDTYDWWNSDAITQETRDEVNSDPRSALYKEAEVIKKWRSR